MNSTNYFRFKVLLFCMMISQFGYSQDTISLAGKWRIALDGNYKDWPTKIGLSREWYKHELPSNNLLGFLNQIYLKNAEFTINDWITLPGSTDEAGIGVVLKESQTYTPGLERLKTYDGAFWVQRKVLIPESWTGKTVYFKMERLLGTSTVFWDDKIIGKNYSLATPHVFTIEKTIESGEHVITVLINKDDIPSFQTGHQVINGNGCSWNGIIGKIELIAKNPSAQINNVKVFPRIKNESIDLQINLSDASNLQNRELKFFIRKKTDENFILAKLENNFSDTIRTSLKIPKPVLFWSEFTPALYELKCVLEENGKPIDTYSSIFGMREIGSKDGYITINGNNVFMRGTLDCGSSPLTGYPPTSKEKWLEIYNICKSYGLNHVRYHTWCPPEAAFEAADEAGIYLQIELSGEPYSEIEEILNLYGNHPSFCMLSLNNEVLMRNINNEELIANARIKDNKHLYTCTTHPYREGAIDDFFVSAWGAEKSDEWPFFKRIVGITWGGGDVVHASRFNLYPPETNTNFSTEINGIKAPIIAHEMGQWAMFPDFDGIPKYNNGVLRNTNYERIKKQIQNRGLLSINKDFAKASGMFSSILYKEEIESILRTPGYDGFQLLGLNDYQGQYISIVGILNDFWESKGLVTPQEHSHYCNSIVPLAKMSKRVWNSNEIFNAEVDFANYSFSDLTSVSPQWLILDEGHNILEQGDLIKKDVFKGGLTSFGIITLSLKGIKKPSKLILNIKVPNSTIENNWDFWVYPTKKADVFIGSIFNGNQLEEVKMKLDAGQNVLLLLDNTTLKQYRESCFSTIFWNSIHKWAQKAHTMGIVCNPNNPVFKDFPTEYHSNWQWWDITMNAYAMNINDLPQNIVPLIRVIDSYIINDNLAYLWECKVGNGKLMVCSIDLVNNLNNRPVSQQLKTSILKYMNSADFNPTLSLEFTTIADLVK